MSANFSTGIIYFSVRAHITLTLVGLPLILTYQLRLSSSHTRKPSSMLVYGAFLSFHVIIPRNINPCIFAIFSPESHFACLMLFLDFHTSSSIGNQSSLANTCESLVNFLYIPSLNGVMNTYKTLLQHVKYLKDQNWPLFLTVLSYMLLPKIYEWNSVLSDRKCNH